MLLARSRARTAGAAPDTILDYEEHRTHRVDEPLPLAPAIPQTIAAPVEFVDQAIKKPTPRRAR